MRLFLESPRTRTGLWGLTNQPCYFLLGLARWQVGLSIAGKEGVGLGVGNI